MVDDCAAPRFNLITAFEPTCQSLAAMACFSDKNVLSLAFNMTWSWLADAPPLASQVGSSKAAAAVAPCGGACGVARCAKCWLNAGAMAETARSFFKKMFSNNRSERQGCF